MRAQLKPHDRSEPADQFTVLPIAEVSCRDETYSVTEYLPPTLRLHPTTPLGQKLASLAKRMREKAVFLQQRINGLIAEGANDQAGDLKQALYAITDNLPEFELFDRKQVISSISTLQSFGQDYRIDKHHT